MPLSPSLRNQLARSFIKELEAFKASGYRFNNGSDKKLFPGTQHEAFEAYLAGVKAQQKGAQPIEGYYEIPTGVGKTALFLAIIGCYLEAIDKLNLEHPPRVLIHVPSNDLEKQTARAFAQFLPKLAPMIETDDEQGNEINWLESEIGFKRKGAAGDKKIIITTYQGQAADERNYVEKAKPRAYKPEDFGLIIHDEAHNVTGAKFGPAAVDKFRGAIQLGVTATPEYSEDKTVANKLGHRYYELPLANVEKDAKILRKGAIQRGDLCHVRPVLIKTRLSDNDRKLLKDKFKDFIKQQNDRPLNDRQLEQLYNIKARNRAVINAYLTGTHPDTGVRYLGQTGMLFAGGIAHCNDVVREAYEMLNEKSYRDVKEWLEKEGLCLIAPIHSDTARGVKITIGGKEQMCSEERIKELHRQGKVLLLISDKKLREGTDFPKDRFGADLIDRFTIPGAVQPFGRLLRVDTDERDLPPDERSKSSAWHNVIDEAIHERYAGTPHHPIHGIEILHGADHRPPGRKEAALRRYNSKLPEVHEAMDKLGFEFEHDVEVLRGVAKKFEENKKQAEKGPPEGYRSAIELGIAIQNVKPAIIKPGGVGSAIIAKIRTQHQQTGTAVYKNIPVLLDAIAEYRPRVSGKTGYAIRQKEFDLIVHAYSTAKDIPDGYRAAEELEIAIKEVNPKFEAGGHTIIRKIRKQHEAGLAATYKNVPVLPEAIAEYDHNGTSAYAIRQREFDQIVAASASARDVPEGHKTALELGQAIQNVRPDFKQDEESARKKGHRLISDIRKQHQTRKNPASYEGIPVPIEAIVEYTSYGRKAYALRQQEFDQIVSFYAIKQVGAPEGYRSSTDLTDAIKNVKPEIKTAQGAKIYVKLRRQLASAPSAEFRGVQISEDAFVEYQSTTGQTSYALRQKEFDAIVATYEPQMSQGKVPAPKKLHPRKWEGSFTERLLSPSDDIEPNRW